MDQLEQSRVKKYIIVDLRAFTFNTFKSMNKKKNLVPMIPLNCELKPTRSGIILFRFCAFVFSFQQNISITSRISLAVYNIEDCTSMHQFWFWNL